MNSLNTNQFYLHSNGVLWRRRNQRRWRFRVFYISTSSQLPHVLCMSVVKIRAQLNVNTDKTQAFRARWWNLVKISHNSQHDFQANFILTYKRFVKFMNTSHEPTKSVLRTATIATTTASSRSARRCRSYTGRWQTLWRPSRNRKTYSAQRIVQMVCEPTYDSKDKRICYDGGNKNGRKLLILHNDARLPPTQRD